MKNDSEKTKPATKKPLKSGSQASPWGRGKPPFWLSPSVKPKRLSAIIAKLDVDWDELRKCPKMTDILMESSETTGGLEKIIEAMRHNKSPVIVKFLKQYDKATDEERHVVPWEVWALKAKVEIPELLGQIILSIRRRSVNMIKVMAMTAHPDIIRKRIEFAKTKAGVSDRNAIDTALGFLPTPKGPTFIGKYYAPDERPAAEPMKSAEEKARIIEAQVTTPALPAAPPQISELGDEATDAEELEVDKLFPETEMTQSKLLQP